MGTQLINGGPCVFLIKDELGISKCGIEQAYYQGLTKFKNRFLAIYILYELQRIQNKALSQ